MPTGSSRQTSTRTTSPLLCSPRSKGDFYSPRYSRVPVRSRPPSIPFWPLPSADEPKPGSFTAIAEVGSRHRDDARTSRRCSCRAAAIRDAGHIDASTRCSCRPAAVRDGGAPRRSQWVAQVWISVSSFSRRCSEHVRTFPWFTMVLAGGTSGRTRHGDQRRGRFQPLTRLSEWRGVQPITHPSVYKLGETARSGSRAYALQWGSCLSMSAPQRVSPETAAN